MAISGILIMMHENMANSGNREHHHLCSVFQQTPEWNIFPIYSDTHIAILFEFYYDGGIRQAGITRWGSESWRELTNTEGELVGGGQLVWRFAQSGVGMGAKTNSSLRSSDRSSVVNTVKPLNYGHRRTMHHAEMSVIGRYMQRMHQVVRFLIVHTSNGRDGLKLVGAVDIKWAWS